MKNFFQKNGIMMLAAVTVVAVLLSALVLKEPMSSGMWLGAALVIGAAVLLELPVKKKNE